MASLLTVPLLKLMFLVFMNKLFVINCGVLVVGIGLILCLSGSSLFVITDVLKDHERTSTICHPER